MAFRKVPSNDTHAGGFGGFNEPIHYFTAQVAGEVTADTGAHTLFICPAGVSGTIVSVVGGVIENGSDANEDLTMTFNVRKNTTSVCSTNPAIAKTAASDARATTAAAGTGITQAVIKTDGTEDFVAGDTINAIFDITIGTADTNITGPSVTVGVKFNAV